MISDELSVEVFKLGNKHIGKPREHNVTSATHIINTIHYQFTRCRVQYIAVISPITRTHPG